MLALSLVITEERAELRHGPSRADPDNSPLAYVSYDVLGFGILRSPTSTILGVVVHQLAFFISKQASGLTTKDGENADIAGAIYLPFRPILTVSPCHSLVVNV
ncbi:hypothetical protein [Shewanella denitrificans]|jgi:hypothetical protein|uniref:hypothetical protein n=1 Tax=Shewanella denitrificans TaxID=192073 RepID=UPI00059E8D38|nr:hypothetical protein [Shewanella denitrificans]